MWWQHVGPIGDTSRRRDCHESLPRRHPVQGFLAHLKPIERALSSFVPRACLSVAFVGFCEGWCKKCKREMPVRFMLAAGFFCNMQVVSNMFWVHWVWENSLFESVSSHLVFAIFSELFRENSQNHRPTFRQKSIERKIWTSIQIHLIWTKMTPIVYQPHIVWDSILSNLLEGQS